jgi:hypothetical protein
MIALADLSSFSESEIIEHLVNNYSRTADSSDDEYYNHKEESSKKLDGMSVILAYESVAGSGEYAESFFLLKRNYDGALFEVHGSHCSCYGFEGQLDLEETIPAALKYRAINGHLLGGFDEFEKDEEIIKDYILSL